MGRKKSLEDMMRKFVNLHSSNRRRPPPRGKRGGSEPVSVEPNRPKHGEGGAAAALEFDS